MNSDYKIQYISSDLAEHNYIEHHISSLCQSFNIRYEKLNIIRDSLCIDNVYNIYKLPLIRILNYNKNTKKYDILYNEITENHLYAAECWLYDCLIPV